jgi:flagellar basal-body rod modification protein FlgD
MSVPATEAVTSNGLYTPSTSTASSTDKEMFLNLMVAQLRYQDPLNPTDSGQFLSQNAQFTALEKMQDVADQTAALLSSQISFGAAGMVGQTVSYLDQDGTSVTGRVDSVSFDASGPTLMVGGASVTLSQIHSIAAGSTSGSTAESTTGSSDNSSTPTTA